MLVTVHLSALNLERLTLMMLLSLRWTSRSTYNFNIETARSLLSLIEKYNIGPGPKSFSKRACDKWGWKIACAVADAPAGYYWLPTLSTFCIFRLGSRNEYTLDWWFFFKACLLLLVWISWAIWFCFLSSSSALFASFCKSSSLGSIWKTRKRFSLRRMG